MKYTLLFFTYFFLLSSGLRSQNLGGIRSKIDRILALKKATVGIALTGVRNRGPFSYNGHKHFPMQSVFKFPIALAVLHEVQRGRLSLVQKVHISKDDLLPGLWSPLQKKYPKGVTLSLAEILQYTVAWSDNVGCDVLLKLLGGPLTVEKYFHRLGFTDIAVKINEETMQSNWDLQFLNWTTPKEANTILKQFFTNANGLLSAPNYAFVWDLMRATKTGKNRLKGKLPTGTIVAHKTGSSGKHKKTNVIAAVNDIGIVFLPNGNYYAISVFVANSKESFKTNEKIIADISKVVWNHFSKNK